MEMNQSIDRRMEHDDSFPIALDENFHRISAIEALLWKRRNARVKFYCPKCYQINPNQKTMVRPSSHKVPRFNRKKRASHLEACQFRNAAKYMEYLSDWFQIPLKEKALQLTIPPYRAGSVMDQSLQTRRSIFEKPQHQLFIQLVEQLLLDYDIDLFFQRYGQYKVSDGKEELKLRQFFQTMETGKPKIFPTEERLQVMIGTVYAVEWSDQYLIAVLDNTQVEYTFSLYFHPYHYSKSTLDLLKNRKVACLGYVQKVGEREYRMEILSIDSQIAFIDDLRPLSSLSPSIKAGTLLDHLLSHTEPFTSIKIRSFKRSYYAHQLRQFSKQHQEQQKKEQLSQLDKKIPNLNERIIELKVSKEQIEKANQEHQKKQSAFLPRLKNMLLFRRSQMRLVEEKYQKELQQISEKIEQTVNDLRHLKAERMKLKEELEAIEVERNNIIGKQKEEKKMKKGIQGFLFEYFFDQTNGAVVSLCPKADRFNAEVEINLFYVKKIEGYYLPIFRTNQLFATDGFTGETEIQTMINKIWKYIDQQIKEIPSQESGSTL